MSISGGSAIAFLQVAFFLRACIASEPLAVASGKSVVRSVVSASGAVSVPVQAPSLGGLALAQDTDAETGARQVQGNKKSPVRKIDRFAPNEDDAPFTSGLLIEFCIGLFGFAVTLMFQQTCRAKTALVRKKSHAVGITGASFPVKQTRRTDGKVPSPRPAVHTAALSPSPSRNNFGPELDEDEGESFTEELRPVHRNELRKLLSIVTATPKPKDVPASVLRTIASIEEREPMNCRQIVDCLTHILRCCASTKCFKEGVAVFDCLESRVGDANPNLWSLLLYVATEAGCFDRCQAFFAQLQCGHGPAGRDFVNIVRTFARRQDLAGLTAVLDDIKNLRLLY